MFLRHTRTTIVQEQYSLRIQNLIRQSKTSIKTDGKLPSRRLDNGRSVKAAKRNKESS